MAKRAGQIPMTDENGAPITETFEGERLVTELMVAAFTCTAVHPKHKIPLLSFIPEGVGVGFDADEWLKVLKSKGWSVTVDGNSVTFAVIRG